MAKSSMYKKPAGRKVGKYFKGKTEDSNRAMSMKGAAHMGKRYKNM